jgi:hypothetical protein
VLGHFIFFLLLRQVKGLTKPSLKALALNFRSLRRLLIDVQPGLDDQHAYDLVFRKLGQDIAEHFFGDVRALVPTPDTGQFWDVFAKALLAMVFEQASAEARGYPWLPSNSNNIYRGYESASIAFNFNFCCCKFNFLQQN